MTKLATVNGAVCQPGKWPGKHLEFAQSTAVDPHLPIHDASVCPILVTNVLGLDTVLSLRGFDTCVVRQGFESGGFRSKQQF